MRALPVLVRVRERETEKRLKASRSASASAARSTNSPAPARMAATMCVGSRMLPMVDFAPGGHAALHLNVRPSFGLLDALQNLHRMDATLLEGSGNDHHEPPLVLSSSGETATARLSRSPSGRPRETLPL